MQRSYYRSSSNTPMLIAAVGLGAVVAYGLASPRRRAALAAAGESALQAGSRFATTQVDRLQDLLPQQALDTVSDFADRARSASQRATATAADTLHEVVDRAGHRMRDVQSRARQLSGTGELGVGAQVRDALHDAVDRTGDRLHDMLARARRMSEDDERDAREQVRDVLRFADDTADRRSVGRSVGTGTLIAAAAIGAGLFAMQRYGSSDRVREKLGADESGNIVSEKSVYIDAPVEQVYDTWSNYDNFPRFMSNVRSVQSLGGDRSHWKLRGPAGVDIEFDAMARNQRPSELGWRSEPGSSVQHEGRVTLAPEGNGTRANVRMSYRPPAGALGQAASSLFGADPKAQFEDDLNRMKQYIESQRTGAVTQSI